MNNSIQYFLENGIPELEKIKKDFLSNPKHFDGYIEKVKGIMLDFGCSIISEVLEECNALLEESLKRRLHWHVQYQKEKKIKEKTEKEICFSATEMLAWEKRHRKTNGKYMEALRASISSQISAKIFFNAAIAGL
ncbi:MAG: hypothetical protein HFH68_05655 [Lachnospiraceae bacterium]|nr:hypothetical protein [Lachnospiraceae bacterium]